MESKNGKFKTLTHNGVVLPPPFEAKGLLINGLSVSPLCEEMLWHYSRYYDGEWQKKEIFDRNFYKCFRPELPKELQLLKFPEDFLETIEKIKTFQEKEKEEKAAFRKEHKEQLKRESEERKEKFGYAYLDGQKQPLGGYMVEGPGIFIARGNSPLLGLWKYQIRPEDITINYVDVDMSKAPKAPDPEHQWKIVSNTNVYHIAEYIENIGNVTTKVKEMRFGNNSTVKSNADIHKYNKAIVLLQHMDEMTKYIKDNLTNQDKKTAECALVSWLLQTTGIRIGNPRDEETQAVDVVGASTLKKENIWAKNGKLYLQFIGKDSVPYKNEIDIPVYIEKALNKIRKGKKDGEQIFSVSSDDVNKFLGKCVEGCTPKLWRTAIATQLLVDAIREQKIKKSMTTSEKLHCLDMACLEVSKKLNHQKNISKNFDAQVGKMNERLDASSEKLKETVKKSKKELKALDDKIETYKANLSGSEQTAMIAKANAKKKLIKERVARAEQRIKDLQMKLELKQQTAQISLGTAKMNYSSPRINFSFSKKYDVPIEKIYTKTLLEKFKWAEDTPKNYIDLYPNVPLDKE